MSVNVIQVAASPDAVFEVLGDPYRYAEWVVGAQKIRGVEGHWPAPGSKFFHSVGVGPFTLNDQTTVEDSYAPNRLVLRAQVRPFLTAAVTLVVTPTATGAEVLMEEHPVSPLPVRFMGPLLDPLTSRRNAAALGRLKELVERGASG